MSDHEPVFAALSSILRRHAQGMSIRTDQPDHLYVEVAPATPKAKPAFFGAVQTKKSYVSYHLMPVYEDPALLDGITPACASACRASPVSASRRWMRCCSMNSSA